MSTLRSRSVHSRGRASHASQLMGSAQVLTLVEFGTAPPRALAVWSLGEECGGRGGRRVQPARRDDPARYHLRCFATLFPCHDRA
eukprot:2109783-Rhodomonas_salina.1